MNSLKMRPGARAKRSNGISLIGQGGFEPFQNLDRHIAKNQLPRTGKPAVKSPAPHPQTTSSLSERELFTAAMADVTPLPKTRIHDTPPAQPAVIPTRKAQEDDTRQALEALVRHGIGFRVSHTPEYIQGSGFPVDPSLKKKLHQGKFAIEAYIDLHGLGEEAAAEALDGFIDASLKSGKRSLLIVHGRGRSSAGKPVLKAMVERTLTQGPYRRWLLAYASARQCDGGTGATQVLFRQRPLSNKQLKQLKHMAHEVVDLPVG